MCRHLSLVSLNTTLPAAINLAHYYSRLTAELDQVPSHHPTARSRSLKDKAIARIAQAATAPRS